MPDEPTYGSQFLEQLKVISKRTQFSYAELQQIKAMNQEELAARLQRECYQFSGIVMSNAPKVAALLYYIRRLETQSGSVF